MKSKDVLRVLDVTRQTLSKYVREGKIQVEVLSNGYFDYNENDVFKLANRGKTRNTVIYARVSTSNQRHDLENQIEMLQDFAKKSGLMINDIYSDVASGMHYERKSFQKLLDDVISKKISNILVSYKDRLGRVSFDMIKKLFAAHGAKIIVVDDLENNKTTEQEFFEDLVSMIHSFSMKMYSKRRKKRLELLKEDLELEKELTDVK